MMRCFLALGSNLGDREARLRAGLLGLEAAGIRIVRCASVYATEPVGLAEQPWFLNTAVEVETRRSPRELLAACQAVEAAEQRRRTVPNGPRTLDIDVIFCGDLVVDTPELIVPHPRYADRRFVLEPLAEIAGEVRDPVTGRTVAEALTQVRDGAGVKRAGPPLL